MADIESLEQARRKVTEQLLDRAASDPDWRRRYVEDPQTVLSETPEAQVLLEGEEEAGSAGDALAAPPEVEEEHVRVQRSLTEKVLDRAASDPNWKRLLLDDAEAAFREADFPEDKRLEELREEAEVQGYILELGGPIDAGVDAAGGCRTYYTRYCRTYAYTRR
jgi:hypothetical protein